MALSRKHEREGERRMAQRAPTYARDVSADLARLKGTSRNDLAGDHARGASSPLGMGSYSKKMERKKGR